MADPLFFLRGDSEMAAEMLANDWSGSSLGPPASWPAALKAAVRTILTTALPALIFWGPDGAYLYNDAYRRAVEPGRALGAPARVVAGGVWPIIGPQIAQVMSGGPSTLRENQLVPIRRDGQLVEVYWTYGYSPIDDPAAPTGVGGVLGICTVTTGAVLAERRIAAEAERQRALFHQAPSFIVMMHGPDHRIEFANAAYLRLVGNRPIVGLTVAEAIPQSVEQGFVAVLDQVFENGEPVVANRVRYVSRPVDGSAPVELFLSITYQPILDAAGVVTGVCAQGADVTELTRAMHRLDALARIDDLTRLPNRMAMIDGLHGAIARQMRDSQPFSLLYIDLDAFKRLNDEWGHAAGDEALRDVASALRRSMRAEDLAGRLGGDEFAVLVRGNQEQALAAAERIRTTVRERMLARGWQVTASIGAATFDQPPASAESALAAADAAMYAVKRAAKIASEHRAG
jgi:diguanylate cyclase (GGDEF)-like protein